MDVSHVPLRRETEMTETMHQCTGIEDGIRCKDRRFCASNFCKHHRSHPVSSIPCIDAFVVHSDMETIHVFANRADAMAYILAGYAPTSIDDIKYRYWSYNDEVSFCNCAQFKGNFLPGCYVVQVTTDHNFPPVRVHPYWSSPEWLKLGISYSDVLRPLEEGPLPVVDR